MRSKIFICCCTLPILSLAQIDNAKDLDGRVTSSDGDVAATHVLNTTTQRATITDLNGFFDIPVRLNDTLIFSAVQFKKKQIIITQSIYDSKMLVVPLEDELTELEEVVVTPYNLSGDITKDLLSLEIEPVVTASTLNLPNAYVRVPTKAERELYEATSGGGLIPVTPILNAISGRTKMLKKRLARNKLYDRTLRVREFYADSLYRTKLHIPEANTDDFFYYCEIDPSFQSIVDTHDLFKIWEFLERKSIVYLENNDID